MMRKGVPPILAGTLIFVVATWYFRSVVPSLFSPNAPVFPPEEMPTPAVPAEEPPTAPPVTPSAFEPAPAVNPRLTRANFDRIRDGMTEEQVAELLGDPTGAEAKMEHGKSRGHQVTTLQWTQLTSPATIEVEFIDGRSGAKSTTLSPAAPFGQSGGTSTRSLKPTGAAIGSSNVTRANFDRIESGMTEQQVLAILGPPTGSSTKKGTINGQSFQTRLLVWRQKSSNVTITVTLRSEKVSGKNCIQVNPFKP